MKKPTLLLAFSILSSQQRWITSYYRLLGVFSPSLWRLCWFPITWFFITIICLFDFFADLLSLSYTNPNEEYLLKSIYHIEHYGIIVSIGALYESKNSAWVIQFAINYISCFHLTALHMEIDYFATPKIFILISTIMTWAKSKPPDPVSSMKVLIFFFTEYFHLMGNIN